MTAKIKFSEGEIFRKLNPGSLDKLFLVSVFGVVFLVISVFLGLTFGSADGSAQALWRFVTGGAAMDPVLKAIIWKLRFPRVLTAFLVGATLSLGGLVFQAILRNPLSEPYVLGISGGAAIGAIIGIQMGFAHFPGISFLSFAGSLVTLAVVFMVTSGKNSFNKDSMILSGVMINAFCSAVIMFLISMSHDSKLQHIIFWLMGDLSSADPAQLKLLALSVIPCFIVVFYFSNTMNILLTGRDMAISMGVDVARVTSTLLVLSSFMVSSTVSCCGLIGFAGLVVPHLLRMVLGPDHRVMVPGCIFCGGSFMILCDLISRTVPRQGEMPVGVITAMIGAPLFVFLLKRSRC